MTGEKETQKAQAGLVSTLTRDPLVLVLLLVDGRGRTRTNQEHGWSLMTQRDCYDRRNGARVVGVALGVGFHEIALVVVHAAAAAEATVPPTVAKAAAAAAVFVLLVVVVVFLGAGADARSGGGRCDSCSSWW